MPALTGSRRRVRKVPSPDNIEEDDPSQVHPNDADNHEDQEDVVPARKTTSVKKEKKAKINGRGSTNAEAGPSNANGVREEDDGDDDRIDIQNFHDQPLDKKEGAKLQGMASDWEIVRKQLHQSSFRLVKDVALSLADVMEAGEAGEAIDEVDALMKKLIDIDQEMRFHEQTLSDLHQAVMRGDIVENVLEIYEDGVERLKDEYNTKTTRQKYASTNEYVEFRQGIYEVQNPGMRIPPINELVPREDNDPGDDEDELEVGGLTQDYKCPITLTVLEDPMTSDVCGHSYSRRAIEAYLKKAGRTGKACPAAGCNQRITMEQLKPDKELEKKIKMAMRRQRRQDESDDEVEEVIE